MVEIYGQPFRDAMRQSPYNAVRHHNGHVSTQNTQEHIIIFANGIQVWKLQSGKARQAEAELQVSPEHGWYPVYEDLVRLCALSPTPLPTGDTKPVPSQLPNSSASKEMTCQVIYDPNGTWHGSWKDAIERHKRRRQVGIFAEIAIPQAWRKCEKVGIIYEDDPGGERAHGNELAHSFPIRWGSATEAGTRFMSFDPYDPSSFLSL